MRKRAVAKTAELCWPFGETEGRREEPSKLRRDRQGLAVHPIMLTHFMGKVNALEEQRKQYSHIEFFFFPDGIWCGGWIQDMVGGAEPMIFWSL